jgi:hypothetical protein
MPKQSPPPKPGRSLGEPDIAEKLDEQNNILPSGQAIAVGNHHQHVVRHAGGAGGGSREIVQAAKRARLDVSRPREEGVIQA